ncbi:MAG: ATP-binding protein [Bdellovibrionaceae bacterium]|nr:ATP-binding protein [Pseudobdellovibrionaceae bacterium]NUM60273.1 ATP-binding protein [Pseudobdellovibrionaceae bacterium]
MIKQKKLAITGGPSGGKTTLIETLKKEFGQKISIVPEAASILYSGGFPRKKSFQGKKHVQRAIYFSQKELESLIQLEYPESMVICDRGSLDSVAYWPAEESDFYQNLQTSKDIELQRYEWVLHLDTATFQDYDTSNPIRTETYEEAMTLNEKIKMAWNGHEQRLIIKSDDDFLMKMTKAIQAIKYILNGKSFKEIERILS